MQNVKTIRQIHRRKGLHNINPHLLTEEAPKQQAVGERAYWGSTTANLLYEPTLPEHFSYYLMVAAGRDRGFWAR